MMTCIDHFKVVRETGSVHFKFTEFLLVLE